MVKYSLGADSWPVDETGRRASYWDVRRELIYYRTLANFVRIIGDSAESLIDVGSANCKYLEWFDWIPDRVSLDLMYPTKGKGIRSLKEDFFSWRPDKKYDVVLCSQVLEHVEDAGRFARKLLEIGHLVLISVPHMWPKGSVKSHIHDPVSQELVDEWFGRKPTYTLKVCEVFGEERLFCFYNLSSKPIVTSWTDNMSRILSHPLAVDQRV